MLDENSTLSAPPLPGPTVFKISVAGSETKVLKGPQIHHSSTIRDLEPDYSGDKGRLERRSGKGKRGWAWSLLLKKKKKKWGGDDCEEGEREKRGGV